MFRDGTFIERLGDVLSSQVELNVPAKLSGAYTMTISGRGHGYFAGDDTVRWTGFRFEEIRPMRDELWNGLGLVPAPLNQPCIMAPFRTDDVTISRNFLLGKRTQPGNNIARYIAGAHLGSTSAVPAYGEPPGYTFTIEDNYGPTTATTGMVDNQRSTPTVTVSLVMTVDTTVGLQPVFTVVGTRSDGQSLDGYGIVLTRDGQDIGPTIFTGNTATFRSEDFTDPLDPGDGPRSFQARWGNSFGGTWDTLGSTSNTITIRPGAVDPFTTTTTLTNISGTPSPEGYAIDLSAAVSPNPYSQQGTVTFYDGATNLGAYAVGADGSYGLTLPAGLSVGAHSLHAVFDGTAAYLTSTSNTVNLTVTAGPGAIATTTSLVASPPSPQTYPQTIALAANLPGVPNGTGGTVSFYDTGTLIGTDNLTTVLGEGSAALELIPDIGTHSYTATYSGAPGQTLGSTSSAVPFVSSVPDTTAPSVIGCDPDDGQLDVDVDQIITITFDPDLPVDPPLVGAGYGGITLTTDEDNPSTINGVIDGPFGDDGVEWTFTPTQPLAFNADYLIRVADFIGVNRVEMSPYLSRFSTGADALSVELVPRGLLVARA